MVLRIWWSFLFALCSGIAAAQLTPPASYTESVELAGEEQAVDVYRPDAESPVRLAIVAHGFTRSRVRHRDLGRALASAGVIAVIPDLPSVMDLWVNGDAIAELAQKLEAGALGLPPVARSRVVLIGTAAWRRFWQPPSCPASPDGSGSIQSIGPAAAPVPQRNRPRRRL